MFSLLFSYSMEIFLNFKLSNFPFKFFSWLSVQRYYLCLLFIHFHARQINRSNSGKLPVVSTPLAHTGVAFFITMIIISLSCSSDNSLREPEVHGKGYKGLILELVCGLPLLGDPIQPSEHQRFTAPCNIQLPHSQPDQEQHGVGQENHTLCNLTVGEGTVCPTYPVPNLTAWRSHNMWTTVSSLPGCVTWDVLQTSEKSVPN